jgi:hypothetical protein
VWTADRVGPSVYAADMGGARFTEGRSNRHRPRRYQVPARIVRHTYSHGEVFLTVQCDDCLVVLNSGHHYGADHERFAAALAIGHNQNVHPA